MKIRRGHVSALRHKARVSKGRGIWNRFQRMRRSFPQGAEWVKWINKTSSILRKGKLVNMSRNKQLHSGYILKTWEARISICEIELLSTNILKMSSYMWQSCSSTKTTMVTEDFSSFEQTRQYSIYFSLTSNIKKERSKMSFVINCKYKICVVAHTRIHFAYNIMCDLKIREDKCWVNVLFCFPII